MLAEAGGCCDNTDMVDTKQNHKKVQINESFYCLVLFAKSSEFNIKKKKNTYAGSASTTRKNKNRDSQNILIEIIKRNREMILILYNTVRLTFHFN